MLTEATTPPLDLLLTGGTAIDPSQGLHAKKDIGIAQGRIAFVEDRIPTARARQVVDCSGLIVTPGLVDLHVHVYEGASHYGIEVDSTCLQTGATTVLDLGSAGAWTFSGFRRSVIDVAQTRVYALLNLSTTGMVSPVVGELEDIRNVDNALTSRVFRANRDVVKGIKLRLSTPLVGKNGAEALRLARELCDDLGVPLVIHPGATEISIAQIVESMTAGDVLTHAYHGNTEGSLDENGKIRSEVRAAADRGVLFDVGHGRGSFSWDVAERAMGQGFIANTISSDLHVYNLHGPVFDLATTVMKFVHLGLTLDEAIARATLYPAQAMGIAAEVGGLRVGMAGDVAAFALEEGTFTFYDSGDVERTARQHLFPKVVVKGGTVVRCSLDH
ncbi:MAG: amidohydrolase/deacetylase family metallohydrolase [Chloroflexi bacterium]|nr:amidohydrolase/deacetylase family metallohydrolase [Chloroflexota bacterium]